MMLNAIRNSMQGTIGKMVVGTLFFILIVSFAIWGIQDIFRNGVRSDTVAKVGDTEISATSFLSEFQRQLRAWQQSVGPQFTAQTAIAAGLDNQVLQRMITRTAFDDEAYSMGLRVSDKQVADYIRSQQMFSDGISGFSRMQYEGILQQIGLSEAQFEQQTRFDIAREYLIDALIGGRKAPTSLVDALYKYRNEKRIVDLAFLPNDTITNIPTPDDATVESYYKDHISRFTAPEYRNLSYIALGPATLMSEVQVTDKALHDLYDSRKDQYMPGEKRRLEAMNFLDEATAQKAHDAVAGGEDFAKAAAQFKATNLADMSVGTVTKADVEQKLGDDAAVEAFAVPSGGVTKPVKNVFGNWIVIHVISTIPGGGKTFEQVKDDLHKELATEKATDALYDMLGKIEDELAGGANLKEVADKFSLSVKTVADVDRTGDTPEGTPVPGLPMSQKFLEFAFNARPGDDLELTDGGNNDYYIIKVDGITPSTPKPLDTVKDQVITSWKEQKRRDMAQDRAKSLVDWADKEKNLATVATTAGGKVVTSKPLLRDGSVSEDYVSQSLLADIFKTDEDKAGWGAAPNGKGYVLFKVKSIETPDPTAAANAADVQKLTGTISENMANDLLAEYQDYVKKDLGVSVNNATVKQALSQISETQ
jgi:peptidyl-prolyl cis-trans isomerase D